MELHSEALSERKREREVGKKGWRERRRERKRERKRKHCAVARLHKPSTGKMEPGRSPVQGQSELQSETISQSR